MTPCDEFEFWADALNSGIPNLQERARFYNDRFSQIYKYYKDLKSVDISGLREVIGNISQFSLDKFRPNMGSPRRGLELYPRQGSLQRSQNEESL